ncbi:hypothetical protein LLEC1_02934 [Akanthomyces lecanii]|uniref:Glyoxalase/fosfomycin resistance/dioxygenase domain-containing protein n=1 Tax=Cordyceps confragosa TaxID=2714763 RepID=A0A179ID53_CORDF|nr:hypothetical protein LLEC1_02934 [Akanthomyces lecanii]
MPDANPLRTLAAISLFTEDVAASKAFYTRIFGAAVVFEDAESCGVRFNNVLLNLLLSSAAGEIVGERHGVDIVVGPETKPWGKRIASFQDPAGHSWEFAQDV